MTAVADRPDIHEAVDDACAFQSVGDGWEQPSCSPVFSASDAQAAAWEREAIGEFDIVQREVFGAPFYQMWYSGLGGTTANDGMEIGYAVSMDGVRWARHHWNPVLRRGKNPGSFDRDEAEVGCAAFDGDVGVFHIWYLGTNRTGIGTTLGHATSRDGVFWEKDILNPLDPLAGTESLLSRIWSCDALYGDGRFDFWAGGVTWDYDFDSTDDFYESARFDVIHVETSDGAHFEGSGDLVLGHAGTGDGRFDEEGVDYPSVFSWGERAGDLPRYWMLYAGYEDVSVGPDPQVGGYSVDVGVRRLGMARAAQTHDEWQRVGEDPLPPGSIDGIAGSPRAFLMNGRLSVFFEGTFADPLGGDPISGIGLGVAPFPDIAEGP